MRGASRSWLEARILQFCGHIGIQRPARPGSEIIEHRRNRSLRVLKCPVTVHLSARFNPPGEDREFFIIECATRFRWRHSIFVVRLYAGEQFTRSRVIEINDRACKKNRPIINPQFRLAHRGVRAVTAQAMLCQDRSNLACPIGRLLRRDQD